LIVEKEKGINVFYFHVRAHDLFHDYHHFRVIFDRVNVSSFALAEHHEDDHFVVDVHVEEFHHSFPSWSCSSV
jgi:hypothetical protein